MFIYESSGRLISDSLSIAGIVPATSIVIVKDQKLGEKSQ